VKHALTFAAALALGASCAGAAVAADTGFSDKICPEATQYVLAVGKTRGDEAPQKVYDVAQAAVDAYGRCSKDKLSNGFREAQHYADLRGGQFSVIAARALIALKRTDEARAELQAHRVLVQQVVDWQSETLTQSLGHAPARSGSEDATGRAGGATGGDAGAFGSDHRPSMYKKSAQEVVAAIDAVLASIGTPPVPTASPAH
jgi:hypothetical protein